MESEVKFRSSAMGYNKSDVNSYIEQIIQEYQDKIKEKDDELAKLRAQSKVLKTQLEETSNKSETIADDKTRIAEILIKAQSTADSMIEEARASASEEKKRLEEAIEKERERLVDLKAEINKLKGSVSNTLKVFEKELNNFEKNEDK